MADLLKEADANSGSLYRFFPGKQDLLVAVLDAYQDEIRDALRQSVWQDMSDPIEKIFALLERHRRLIADSDCLCGCPIGSLVLEIHAPDSRVRERLAAYFQLWTDAVHQCLLEAGARMPATLDRCAFAEFMLTTVEGALVQALAFRDVAYFDRAVCELRNYVDMLLYGRPGLSTPLRQALATWGGQDCR